MREASRTASIRNRKRKLVLVALKAPRLLGTRFHIRLYCGGREGRSPYVSPPTVWGAYLLHIEQHKGGD